MIHAWQNYNLIWYIYNYFFWRACTIPCLPNGKKNMTSNISEVLLKTVPFNGVVYSDVEGLYSKKDLRSPYFRNIKTTYSENEVWRSINIYASDNLSIDWRPIYSFPWMNALFTLNLMSFSIKLWTEFYPSMISFSKIGMCESTPLCTSCHSMFLSLFLFCTKFLEFNSTAFWKLYSFWSRCIPRYQ